jgi:hypothetical protein
MPREVEVSENGTTRDAPPAPTRQTPSIMSLLSVNEEDTETTKVPERPTLFLTFSSREDEKAYLKYLRSTYKFSIINFGMICAIVGLLVFRFVLKSSPVSGPFFITALVANIIAYILILIFVATHVEAIFFTGATLWARMLDMVPFHAEDLIIMWTTLSASLNMLYITVNLIGYENLTRIGSAQHLSITEATVRAAQTIPFEQVRHTADAPRLPADGRTNA